MSELAPVYRWITYAVLVVLTLLVLEWFSARRGAVGARPPAGRAPAGARRSARLARAQRERYEERHAR